MGAETEVVDVAPIIRDILHELNYKAEILEDDAVGSATAGLKFYVQPYGPSIQFRCSMNLEGEIEDWHDFVNDFNSDMRFSKCYTVDDDTLIVEADWMVDPRGENSIVSFKSAMEIWEVALAELKDRLFKKAKDSISDDGQGPDLDGDQK